MNSEQIAGLIWAGAIVAGAVLLVMAYRARKRGGAYRSAVMGATWEWQSQDKRKAQEIIEEEKAEARDPEFAEGEGPEGDDRLEPWRKGSGS
jgi:hypothetical protein